MHSGFQNAINHIDKTFGYLIFFIDSVLSLFLFDHYLFCRFYTYFYIQKVTTDTDGIMKYKKKNVSLSSVIIQNISLLKETLLNTV